MILRTGGFHGWKSVNFIEKGVIVSRSKLKWRPNEFNVKSYFAKRKPFIPVVFANLRLKFARIYVDFPDYFFRKIIFIDECAINFSSEDIEKIYVKRCSNEDIKPENLRIKPKFKGSKASKIWVQSV